MFSSQLSNWVGVSFQFILANLCASSSSVQLWDLWEVKTHFTDTHPPFGMTFLGIRFVNASFYIWNGLLMDNFWYSQMNYKIFGNHYSARVVPLFMYWVFLWIPWNRLLSLIVLIYLVCSPIPMYFALHACIYDTQLQCNYSRNYIWLKL